MIQIRVYGRLSALREIGLALQDAGEVGAIGLIPAVQEDHAVLSGIVRRDAADEVLRFLSSRGVPDQDVARAGRTGGRRGHAAGRRNAHAARAALAAQPLTPTRPHR